jgi:hypothetical protein
MPAVKKFQLDNLIAPEIVHDRFYAAIGWLSQWEDLRTVLEIGSSAGAGSTRAFVEGLSRNPNHPILYCIELSLPRFEKLGEMYAGHGFVKCYNASSVPPERFPSEEAVANFYHSHRGPLNNYPLDRVLDWLRQDIDYIAASGAQQNGIQLIKTENLINTFDMVLIDGSEFTGEAELDEVYGAKIICLDDTKTFKNYGSRHRLINDPSYQLIIDEGSLRNGFSVFCRHDLPSAWREQQMHLNRRGRPAQRSMRRSLLRSVLRWL